MIFPRKPKYGLFPFGSFVLNWSKRWYYWYFYLSKQCGYHHWEPLVKIIKSPNKKLLFRNKPSLETRKENATLNYQHLQATSQTNKPKVAYNKQTWQHYLLLILPVCGIARFGCQKGNSGQSRDIWLVQKPTLYSLDTSITLHSAYIEKQHSRN